MRQVSVNLSIEATLWASNVGGVKAKAALRKVRLCFLSRIRLRQSGGSGSFQLFSASYRHVAGTPPITYSMAFDIDCVDPYKCCHRLAYDVFHSCIDICLGFLAVLIRMSEGARMYVHFAGWMDILATSTCSWTFCTFSHWRLA